MTASGDQFDFESLFGALAQYDHALLAEEVLWPVLDHVWFEGRQWRTHSVPGQPLRLPIRTMVGESTLEVVVTGECEAEDAEELGIYIPTAVTTKPFLYRVMFEAEEIASGQLRETILENATASVTQRIEDDDYMDSDFTRSNERLQGWLDDPEITKNLIVKTGGRYIAQSSGDSRALPYQLIESLNCYPIWVSATESGDLPDTPGLLTDYDLDLITRGLQAFNVPEAILQGMKRVRARPIKKVGES